MKKLYNILAASVAALAALTACTPEEYQPGSVPDGVQVYFSNNNTAEFVISGDVTSIDLDVLRVDDSAANTFTIEVTDTNNVFFDKDVNDVQVSFAKGEKKTKLSIPVDMSKLEDGATYALSAVIKDENATTPYGLSSFSFKVTIPEPFVLLGEATLFDDLITFYYNVPVGTEWQCEVYTNTKKPGILFFKNAFTSMYPHNDPGDYDEADRYFQVNVEDPTKVYIPMQKLGLDWGDGELAVASMLSQYFTGASDAYGTLKDGVITFPVKGILGAAYGATVDGWYYANSKGEFVIHLPGAILTDYSVSAEYAGMFVTAAGEAAPVIDFEAGADVASINYLVIPQAEDVNAAFAKILAGDDSVETLEVADGAAELKIDGIEPGLYTIIYCPVDAEGNLQADDADYLDFYFPGVNAEVPECEGSCKLLDIDMLADEATMASKGWTKCNSVAFAIYGKDVKTVQYYLNKKAVIEGAAADGLTPEIICAEYGNALPEQHVASINANGYFANVFSGLSAETEYMLVVNMENTFGSAATFTATYTTKALPYDGELVIGEYSDFTLTYAGTENQYIVNNMILEDDSEWKAVYNSAANTLTLSGVQVGLEKYGNLFGTGFGYWDAEKTLYYAYDVYSAANLTNENAAGNDELVFNVDPTTHKVASYACQLDIDIFKDADDSYVGTYVSKKIGTAVTFGAAATSSVKSIGMKKSLKTIAANEYVRPARSLKATAKPVTKNVKAHAKSVEKAF
ncbi:MAG: hypothetical protein MJZ07_06990 [Bacteroidales bacterium]|nr:hypothetical protein [Bacteroidales bacterium]